MRLVGATVAVRYRALIRAAPAWLQLRCLREQSISHSIRQVPVALVMLMSTTNERRAIGADGSVSREGVWMKARRGEDGQSSAAVLAQDEGRPTRAMTSRPLLPRDDAGRVGATAIACHRLPCLALPRPHRTALPPLRRPA